MLQCTRTGWMTIPAKRAGTVEEVSSAVTWLLSPGARYVSGSTLTVDAALSNVKASVAGSLKLSYDEPWPVYGKR
jgi:NAD(P)-dependent dehydrogenase (short-subunit alcohol dehydrogenase family)